MLAIKESELRRGRFSILAGGERWELLSSHIISESKRSVNQQRSLHLGPVVHLSGGGVVRWMRTLCYYPRVSGPQLNYNYRVSEEDRELMGPRPGNELWGG